MRFAIIFAGYLIALAIDADALYDQFNIFLLVSVMFVALYVDIVTISFDNIQDLKKKVEENKKQPKGE